MAVSFAAQNCKLVSGPPKVAKKARAHAKRSNMQTTLKVDSTYPETRELLNSLLPTV